MKTCTLRNHDRPQRGATIALALSMLLASLGTSIANIALPMMTEAFSVPFSQVQAVVVAYLAALTGSVIVAGRLGDRFGLKRMLAGGLGLFLTASMLCALAPDLWWLVGARTLQGVGAAFLMTLPMALMRQTAGPAHLGRAMGLLGTVSALGTALGPALGGLLIPVTGWRGIFWLLLPFAAIALAMAIMSLPQNVAEEKTSPVRLSAVMEKRLLPGLLINMLVAAVMMTTLVVGPFYLSLGLGLTGSQAGLVMAVGPVISIFSGVPSGRLVDAVGSARVLWIGLSLLALGAVLLALLPQASGIAGYLVPIAVLTVGYQLFQAANNTVVMAEVGPDRRGTVSGILTLSRNIGLIAGASAMGLIFSLAVGADDFSHASPAAIAGGTQVAFRLVAGMIAIAAAIHGTANLFAPREPVH